MQVIEFEDDEKRKKKFSSFLDALHDAENQEKKKPIKKLKITRLIPSRRNR